MLQYYDLIPVVTCSGSKCLTHPAADDENPILRRLLRKIVK